MSSVVVALAALAATVAPTWRPIASASYTALVHDDLDDGPGPLRPYITGTTLPVQPNFFVVEPGHTGTLQLLIPTSVASPALTMTLDNEGHTRTVVVCEVDGVDAVVGTALRARTLRVAMSACPPGRSQKRVVIAVTNLGAPGRDVVALALDSLELGVVNALPPVGTWASLVVLVVSFAVLLWFTLGPSIATATGPAALAVLIGTGLAARGGRLTPELFPWGATWNAALQASAMLIAVAAMASRRRPERWRALALLTLAWLTALGLAARWTELETTLGDPLWADVTTIRAFAARMTHPFDSGTREPLWAWVEWLLMKVAPANPHAERVVSLGASVAAIPAIYAFASAYGRSRLLGLLAAAALASHAFLAMAAVQGHRTEWLVLEFLGVAYFALVEPLAARTRTIGLSVATAALVATSLNGLVLVAGMLVLVMWRGRVSRRQAAVVALTCAALLTPHVIYNYQQFGTYSWFSARAVPIFYRNYEFMVVKGTGCDGCPTKEQFATDSYSGRPIGMAEYLFGLHTPSDVVRRTADGFYRAFVAKGIDLGALVGDVGPWRRWLFLIGLLLAACSARWELLAVPVLALNLSAFVVPLDLDPRLFTQPVGVAMVIMVLPVFYVLRLTSRWFELAGGAAMIATETMAAMPAAGDEVVGDVAASSEALLQSARAGAVTVSVIVPVYNERHLVAASLAGVLALDDPAIAALQVIVVDDRSTDSSWSILERLARQDRRVIAVRHRVNGGKGAAVQTGLRYCTGDVTIIHDADLEYDPRDIPAIVRPMVSEGADAVFGSRYLSAGYRRALRFKHSLMNRGLTWLSNWFTDLDLSDVETCYKAVRTPLLKSIPIRSRDFRLEIELAMKLAKRRARVYEVPIRYLPRTYREGKKIGARDGLLALGALVHFSLVDDIYQQDAYGSQILNQLERTRRFNTWMGDTLRPHLGDRVLEIGAGIGTLTEQMIPRDSYTVSDINPVYLAYLRSYVAGKPYLKVRHIDASRAEDFAGLHGSFDTVMMVNVLEHVLDEKATLDNVFRALEPGGRYVVLVPQHPGIYGTLDEALEHRERYTRAGLRRSLEGAGFVVEQIFDFNRASVPGWWFNGRVLKRRTFSRFQLKVFDTLVPLLRHVDRLLPYGGQSVIGIARKPGP